MSHRAGARVARSLALHPWWEDGPGERVDARDAMVARDLAQRIVRDPETRSAVRALLLRLEPTSGRAWHDDELRAQVEAALASGRLFARVLREPTLFVFDVDQSDDEPIVARREASEVPAEQEEECIPCREARAAQQAAVLRAAASSGTPFCAVT